MLVDAPNTERDLADFNKRYGDLINADTSGMTVILRSHLIVEHFIDEYLPKAHPGVQDWDAARLTFAQKVAFIDHPRSNLTMVMPGIRALNRARNKIAHTLDAALPPGDLRPMEEFVRVWYGAAGKPIPTGMDAVPHFALTVAGFLHGSSRMIERHSPQGGIMGLLAWHEMA
ncbi:MAG: hypothetical protein KF684_08615 [Phycisphaeraceae bacterium]|nr:hypothetical protein [Phycisphaeraceae bacterium]